MRRKKVKEIEEFQENNCYSFVNYSPMGSTSNHHNFVVLEISKKKNRFVTLSDNGETHTGQLSELKKALAGTERDYFYCKRELFSKQLSRTISEHQKEVKKLEMLLSRISKNK